MDEPEYEVMLATMSLGSRWRRRLVRLKQNRLRYLVFCAVSLYIVYLLIRILFWNEYIILLQRFRG